MTHTEKFNQGWTQGMKDFQSGYECKFQDSKIPYRNGYYAGYHYAMNIDDVLEEKYYEKNSYRF